jgi:hypothetical protein
VIAYGPCETKKESAQEIGQANQNQRNETNSGRNEKREHNDHIRCPVSLHDFHHEILPSQNNSI